MKTYSSPGTARRILAVASAGGHWHQLGQVCARFDPDHVTYVTTMDGLPQKSGFKRFSLVQDCNKNAPLKALLCTVQMAGVLMRTRPDVIITTGALPGVIALVLGWMFRRRTIWVDSIANAEEASSAGKLAKRFATLWLSQWESVAKAEGGRYEGSVL
ncbi:UDP-N-acetylglucosamine--LPS N-acetylglucosamine transferase (plasmid) [Aliiroseovarius sp. M344]|uniref:UDP-N-acetylglucosamine--LPS N-acetylglucosamine transferase n=1 Tax=Aliiroseovarius sp. M344 TaxID=2867010 RepID=UPI0021AD786E|nr:UDP-N-acetylglucosamine--LPS N-acetylglucosamine transferase [Aliiroseovarius sp. M344]UWQ16072.1 UDP-N-acetylglucosamine--LPS N-acetylglucosamine transferase [Aliiroseovarius sp. M344]